MFVWKWDFICALTHEVHDQLARAGAEDEVPHEVGDEGEGDADQRHEQVAGGQRQQEQVGDGPHASVPHEHRDDQAVSQDAEEEDEAVEDDPHRLVHIWGREVRKVPSNLKPEAAGRCVCVEGGGRKNTLDPTCCKTREYHHV